MQRRDFLRLFGVAGAGVAAGQVAMAQPAGAGTKTRKVRVAFRRSSVGQPACNACKAHNANRFYRTRKAAKKNRPHRGCNCVILTQTISNERWNRFFDDGDRKVRQAVVTGGDRVALRKGSSRKAVGRRTPLRSMVLGLRNK